MSAFGSTPAIAGNVLTAHEPLLREHARVSYARLSEQARGELVAERLRTAREDAALRELAAKTEAELRAGEPQRSQLTAADVKLLAGMVATFVVALAVGGLLLAAAGALLT